LSTPSIIIHCQEEFEDTKGVIRIRKPKEDRQHNGKKKKPTVNPSATFDIKTLSCNRREEGSLEKVLVVPLET